MPNQPHCLCHPGSDAAPACVSLAVTIPVFNQLHYTQQCLDSLNRAGVPDEQIVVVNNGSTDGTAEFLANRPRLRSLHNPTNRGCGPAWTQGVLAAQTTWTIVMNNDVLVPSGFIEGLLTFAQKDRRDIVSPAMFEGELDYDFSALAPEYMQLMQYVRRSGIAHGVCFLVHQRVFEAIGHFNDFGGYEDVDFFQRARQANFRLAITGAALLHHFGSVTQKSINTWLDDQKALARRSFFREKSGHNWVKHKITQMRNHVRNTWWCHTERLRQGHTLWEKREGGRCIYR